MRVYKYLIIGLLTPFFNDLSIAQSSNWQITGFVTDTTSGPLALASLMVLHPQDSTLVTFAQADQKGHFIIKNLKSTSYLLKITYVGFLPKNIPVSRPGGESILELGQIKMLEISKELFEVVIKTAKAPMTIRGDTIEYDATKFKVPKGSTVEDLLRRLPGMEVSADGTISTEGQEIRKVTVDGRKFFGGDPKSATKNLPAEGISKVQLFTEETEEKKLTGVSSAPPEKMINLTLKDEFKNGSFGKLIAGAGSSERTELKGNFNKFNESMQFSFIGSANNTGRNGLGWDDYQDFRGNQSFNWNDLSDFGFGGGGDFGNYSFEDEGSISGSFFGGRQSGLPKNGSGGLNYTWFNDKTEINSVYFYNFNELFAQAIRTQENYLPDQYFKNNDSTTRINRNMGHQALFRGEHKFDSMHTLVINLNGQLSNRLNDHFGNLQYSKANDIISNLTQFDNTGETNSISGNGSAVFRKKYKNKGRSSGISAALSRFDGHLFNEIASDNNFFIIASVFDSLYSIRQTNETSNQNLLIKSSIMHVEPIGNKFFSQTFYNFSQRREESDRDVFDLQDQIEIKNDFLSRDYSNLIQTQRLGTSLRYSHQGTNVSIGLARQIFNLNGEFNGGVTNTIDRQFQNWIPNLSFNNSTRKNQYLHAFYSVNAREPRIQDLQPIIDNSNPLYIRIGNPALIPQIDHRIGLGLRKNNPINFTNFNINVNGNFSDNQFVLEQNVDSNLVTTARIINYKGMKSAGSGLGFGFPIVKTKISLQLSYNFNISESFALVNGFENETFSIANSGFANLNITPNESISAFLSTRFSLTNTKYSIESSQNQQILTQNFSANLNAKLFWGILASANLNYDRFINERFNFNQEVPILNATVYKIFGKKNQFEIRISVYDIFNRNLGVNLVANGNIVSETRTTTLKRYGLLSFTYNIRGINYKVNQQNYHFH
ncbi:MAG: outer membrane beta-barrel protein [Saprospiraceae bacterium]|nr:outer membrane beta-barrel protein [Saprospiraceae bacterium]